MPMAATPDYYDLLGVTSKADVAEIKRAYYAKMRQHHPDSFMAERTRLQIVGDQNALRALDKRIDDAKKITQRLNTAYTVLSDVDQRAAYDRQRREERERAWRAAQDDPRIVVKRRPHRRPPSPQPQTQHQYSPSPAAKPDKFPTVWIVGFVIMLLIVSTFMSNFFGYGLQNTYVVSPSRTPAGYVPVGSTDATARALLSLTEQVVLERTANPPTLDTYIRAGDRLYEDGLYRYALESYTSALQLAAMPDIYVKRARVSIALDHEWEARQDFTAALALDSQFVPAYVERGLLIFARWQTTQNPGDADLARADLLKAQELGDLSETVQTALDALP